MGLPAWLATIVHVPAAARVVVEPATVQTLGVADAKLTERPELAVAVNAGVVPAVWGGIAPKVIVCSVVPVPTPLSEMVCVAYAGTPAFSVVSVTTKGALKTPGADGAKLTANWHPWPALTA